MLSIFQILKFARIGNNFLAIILNLIFLISWQNLGNFIVFPFFKKKIRFISINLLLKIVIFFLLYLQRRKITIFNNFLTLRCFFLQNLIKLFYFLCFFSFLFLSTFQKKVYNEIPQSKNLF